MLDPENDPQAADPPDNNSGSGGSAQNEPEDDSVNALTPADPPDNTSGTGG